MKLIKIETERLRLRPLTTNDLDDLHRLWTDADVRKYLWDDQVISKEQAEEVITSSIESFETNGFGFWAVLPKDEESLIGFCGFRFFGEAQEIEILYAVAPANWGQGLASEAARAMMRCGFEDHGFDKIYAGADPPNAASFRVMEKIGMKFAKRPRINDVEAIYYVLSKKDFRPGNSAYKLFKA
jgi:[ribosomal protein S5]-alanine N-acetyltransferase